MHGVGCWSAAPFDGAQDGESWMFAALADDGDLRSGWCGVGRPSHSGVRISAEMEGLMPDLGLWDMAWRLVVAFLLGGLIGLEREAHERPAGLRTHVLVCLGATLFALCSYKIAGVRFDPGRVTAQIVTGIGFLGAGTIIRQGSIIRGLTTAASIWTVAAIGIAVAIGGDMVYLALIASALAFIALTVARNFERSSFLRHGERTIVATVRSGHEPLAEVLELLAKYGARVRVVTSEEARDGTSQIVRIRLRAGRGYDEAALGGELASCENVISYTWE